MFLQRFGQQATIIDKALSFEKLGYVLSLKSFGLKLIGELGLIEELDKRSLTFDSLRFCRANGRLIQEYSQKIAQAMGHGAALIYRAELQEILYDTVRKTLPVRFGVRIASVEQSEADIEITFSNGEREVYDVVIISERMRPLAFVAYDKALRPVVEHFHHTARANVDNLLSRSRGREFIRNAIMRWLPPTFVARQVGKQFHSEDKLLEGIF